MMKHRSHLLMCGALILIALVAIPATGNAFILLPALACMAMMFVMMQAMGGMGHGDGKGD